MHYVIKFQNFAYSLCLCFEAFWDCVNTVFGFVFQTAFSTFYFAGNAVRVANPRLVLKHGTPECRNAGTPEY